MNRGKKEFFVTKFLNISMKKRFTILIKTEKR